MKAEWRHILILAAYSVPGYFLLFAFTDTAWWLAIPALGIAQLGGHVMGRSRA